MINNTYVSFKRGEIVEAVGMTTSGSNEDWPINGELCIVTKDYTGPNDMLMLIINPNGSSRVQAWYAGRFKSTGRFIE